MKKFFLVVVMLMAIFCVSPVYADVSDGTGLYVYNGDMGAGGKSSNLAYDAMNHKLMVTMTDQLGASEGYAISDIRRIVGTFTLPRVSNYNSWTRPNNITVVITSISDTEVTYFVTTERLSMYDFTNAVSADTVLNRLPFPAPCSTQSGTGPCDQVNTTSEWWKCFRCCFAIGGCAAS